MEASVPKRHLMCSNFDRTAACDRRTNRHTVIAYTARYIIATRGKNRCSVCNGVFWSVSSSHLVWLHLNWPHLIWTECTVTGRSHSEPGRNYSGGASQRSWSRRTIPNKHGRRQDCGCWLQQNDVRMSLNQPACGHVSVSYTHLTLPTILRV